MAGLVPAIHVLAGINQKAVDARVKPGHDGGWCRRLRRLPDAGGFRSRALHAFRHFARNRALLLNRRSR